MTILARVLCSITILASAVAAVLAKSLIRAAIFLALGNVALSLLFFLLGAPYAGGVQLSVGAGLVSALFVVAVSLTESVRADNDE